jgi:hypothetical protein
MNRNNPWASLGLPGVLIAASIGIAVTSGCDAVGDVFDPKPPIGIYESIGPGDLIGFTADRRTGRGHHDDFVWSFTDQGFQITGARIPREVLEYFGLPAATTEPVDPTDQAVIRGAWSIDDTRVVLTDVHCDAVPTGVDPVPATVFRSAPTIIRIQFGGDQYVFTPEVHRQKTTGQ